MRMHSLLLRGSALLLTAGLLLPLAPQALAASNPPTVPVHAMQPRPLPPDPNTNVITAPSSSRVVHLDQPKTMDSSAGTSLVNNSSVISGPLSVHLVYTDQNGQPQDLDLARAQNLPAALPDGFQQLHTSQLLTQPLNSSFNQLWTSL